MNVDGYSDLGRKVRNVAIIIGIVIVLCLIITVLMPLFRSTTSYAVANVSGNYWGYKSAMTAAPLWIYCFPVIIGGGLIWLELRSPLKG
jgi:hypothetical protein